MKYIVTIILSSILVGSLLSLGVYFILGSGAGYFFAKFIAGPAGIVLSLIIFLVYDGLYPKTKSKNG